LADVTAVGPSLVLEGDWRTAEGGERTFFLVLTLRDGKIVQMQDCRTRKAALRHAARRS
jgi:hypothetical protein